MNFREFLQITVQNFRIFLNSGTDGSIAALADTESVAEATTSSATGDWVEFGEETATSTEDLSALEGLAEPAPSAPADRPSPEDTVATGIAQSELFAMLESLLFVAGEPVEASQLAKALDLSLQDVEKGLGNLRDEYAGAQRGLRLQERGGKYALVTTPAAATAIETFLNLDLTTKLSGPALETLAIVAYRQPATRGQIEAVRGVDCAGVLRSLTQRGLIEEIGRLDAVGRPILYGVTDLFMQHFGLTSMEELPPLESKEEDMLWATTKLAELEEGQVNRG